MTSIARQARKAAWLRRAEVLWYSVAAIALLGVIAAALIAAASVTPRFCATCHETQVDALARSAHRTLSCDGCHSGVGAWGLLENRLRVAKMVMQAPMQDAQSASTGALLHEQRCEDCHGAGLKTVTISNGVRMNHVGLLEAGWSCMRCHRATAHAESGLSLAAYNMGACLECHSTQRASLSTCVTCHPGEEKPRAERHRPTLWQISHGPNWRTTHGMGELSTCASCHAEDYCAKCHTIRLPHSPNYLSVHGDDVLAVGTESCVRCHAEPSCVSCHGGIQMPHPADFAKRHGADSSEEMLAACDRCHAEESCSGCHERHRHPGVPSDHLEQLRARPVESR